MRRLEEVLASEAEEILNQYRATHLGTAYEHHRCREMALEIARLRRITKRNRK